MKTKQIFFIAHSPYQVVEKLLEDVSLFWGSCSDEILRRELRYFQRGRFANDISDAQAGTLALSLAQKNLSQTHSEYMREPRCLIAYLILVTTATTGMAVASFFQAGRVA